MSNRSTWRLGFVGFIYTPPAEITDPIEKVKWHMSKTQELGGGVTQIAWPIDWTDANLNIIKEHMAKTDNEVELGIQIFGTRNAAGSLIGENKEEIKKGILERIKIAKFLGTNILRSAYGRLNIATSRFNKEFPLKEHMKFVVDNLKETAKILEDHDMYLALENHCDFTGKEFAQMFGEVGSKHIGCTLDSANGFTVYCDPNEDVEYLAPYAVTTHIKDMLVVDFKSDYGLHNMQARGCAVGDGHVDIKRCLDLLDEKSPFSKGLHIVIEHGWMSYEGIADPPAYEKECVHKGLAYLKGLMGR